MPRNPRRNLRRERKKPNDEVRANRAEMQDGLLRFALVESDRK